jgi:DNA-binding beta-propeller fold protein YncE
MGLVLLMKKIKFKKTFSLVLVASFLLVFVFQHALVLLAASPTVMTDGTSNITKTSAYLYGSTTNDGGQTVSEEGFNWGLTASYGSTVVATETGIYLENLSFGDYGVGDGQFEIARAIDIDTSGNLYVTDAGSGRGSIQKFDSSGTFIARYGTFGNGNGQLSSPSAIKVDGAGNIFVADTGNNRVQKLDSSGNYVFKITGSPNFFTFSGVNGVAVDSSGNIYVSDGGHHLVEKYDSTGAHVSTYGSLFGSGTGNNEFNAPQGLFIDASDNLYVVDSGNNRIMKFNSAGVYQSQFGTAGSGNGQFNTPTTMDINSEGDIYVLDYLNYRIQKFNSSGTFLSSFGVYGTEDYQLSSPFGIAITSDDLFWITDDYKVKNFKDGFYDASITGLSCGTTYHYQAYSENSDGVSNSADATFSTLACETPEPVTGEATTITDSSFTLDGLTPDNNSISLSSRGFEYGLTTSYGQSVNESDSLFKFDFGSVGTGNGQFNSPGNTARDSLGNIYVTDLNNNRVQKFNSSGVYQSQFGSAGTGNGQFGSPTGIAVDSADNVYVVDTNNNRVQRFNSAGVYQSQFGTNGSGNGQFSYPYDIDIDSAGNIFVVEVLGTRVQKFNSAGVYQSQFGTSGSGDSEFANPYGLFIDSADNIFVADSGNNRVQKFNSSGVYQSQFGTGGSGDGEFSAPADVSVDTLGNIYVVDTGNSRVQKFDTTGTYQSQFGESGTADGQFASPYGISIDGSDNIFVTDNSNNRVQVFNELYELTISGLTCGNTYHYRAFAVNSDGTGYGSDETFDTVACATTGGGGGGSTTTSSTKLICTDPTALNYTNPATETGKEDNDRCRYPETHLSCDENFFLSRPVKFGANNNPDDVKLLEKYLNTYEGYSIPVDGFYSKTDFNAVVIWQEKYSTDILKPWGLNKGTGFVYITSLRKIKEISDVDCAGMKNESTKDTCFIYVENVEKPRTGGMVRAVQKALKASGFLSGATDGIFGKITEGAVKSFQKSKGINQTGIVGPLTGAELEKVDCIF